MTRVDDGTRGTGRRASFEVRPVTYACGGGGPLDAVEVWIGGTSLAALTSPGVDEPLDAPMALADVFGQGGALWLGGPPVDPDFVRKGRTAVLTCSCGTFGCGGVRARITFTDDDVTWDDFRAVGGRAIDLAYTFARTTYEAAIIAVRPGDRPGAPPAEPTVIRRSGGRRRRR